MKEIALTKGKTAIVDDEDFESLNAYKWKCDSKGYAARMVRLVKPGKQTTVLMHRVIMGAKERSITVDHINGNPLDNRKQNLRLCTFAQNCANSKKPKNNTSGFKGVVWNKQTKRWVARIRASNVLYQLGSFADPEVAHAAYCAAAKELHGEFARYD